MPIIDPSGIILTPGNGGRDCLGNGRAGLELCCDECDFYLCCFGGKGETACLSCRSAVCPRKRVLRFYVIRRGKQKRAP